MGMNDFRQAVVLLYSNVLDLHERYTGVHMAVWCGVQGRTFAGPRAAPSVRFASSRGLTNLWNPQGVICKRNIHINQHTLLPDLFQLFPFHMFKLRLFSFRTRIVTQEI
jgi:hypothetical protein